MSLLGDIEKRIDERVRAWFRTTDGAAAERDLVEVRQALLEEIAGRSEVLPRGRRIFPFRHLVVRLAVPAPERRVAYEMVFAADGALAQDIRRALQQDGCELPGELTVETVLEEEPAPELLAKGYAVEYRAEGAAAAAPTAGRLQLTIVHGAAETTEYTFTQERINLGRLADVPDSQRRLVRRNDVVFADGKEPPNSTVSRAHAHIVYEQGQWRLFDDGSSFGTTVLRGGRIVPVPKGGGRGVALRDGDEVLLGQARVRVGSAPVART